MSIRVRIEATELRAERGTSLFECAESAGYRVTSSCLKQGTCRECIVEVMEGAQLLTPPAEQERHLRGRFRLACRARLATEDGVIEFRRLHRGSVRVVASGERPAGTEPSRRDPAVTRDGHLVRLDGKPLLKWDGPLHGLAVDVGTTTVVVRLVDLETGAVRATQTFENPQCFAGSDIMARISYASSEDAEMLPKTLTAYINQAIGDLHCEAASIFEVVVVGNSTMRDLFWGLDVSPLGQSPYRSLTERELAAGRRTTTSLSAPAHRRGLHANRKGRVYVPPLIGSHVGADAAVALLAIGALEEERTIAFMDIGTNTELLIGNRHRMFAASCPAGPAFEGGSIASGMPAFPGAIEAIRLDTAADPSYAVIGGGPPQGICGSGLVDALGELLRTGGMTALGRLGRERFVIDSAADIYLSEADISRLAQAKGAQAAGWAIVMKHFGGSYARLNCLYLAGGFANHLDIEAAQRIGLIPSIPSDRVVPIGNAAIEGATLALQSVSLRRRLESFVTSIEHVELETDESFFDAFVEGCQFKPFGDTTAGGLD